MTVPHMPMMNEQGFLNCPFCGCDDVGIAIDEDGWEYIECGDCYCRTDAFHNRELMTKSWNTRNGHLYTAEDFNQVAEERDYGL